jgi:hypothetical protein
MFGQNRDQLRHFFVATWHKRLASEGLQPLEKLVAQIIETHPEYHAHLQDRSQLHRDFSPEQGETNPWLHMAMHITLGEQVGADRPAGIRSLYGRIVNTLGDPHEAEHAMMECLGLALWEAQRDARAPDDASYLECLRKLARDK